MQLNALSVLFIALASVGLGFGFGMVSGDAQAAPPPLLAAEDGADTRRPDRGPRQLGARASSGGPVEAVARAVDHSASVAEAAQRFSAEPAERTFGPGTIDGTVRTLDGTPLEGVQIVATTTSAPKPYFGASNRGAGAPPPEPSTLQEALDKAARDWQQRRDNRFEARTGADGRFLVEGLPESGVVSVRAYKENWRVSSLAGTRIGVGGTVDFIASEVHGIEFELVLPDGSRPERGTVQLSTSRNNWSSYEWTSDAPRIRFSERTATVRAYAYPFGSRRSAGKGVAAEYLSESTTLTEEDFQAGKVRLELAVQHGIRARYADPEIAGLADRLMLYQLDENDPDADPAWGSPKESTWTRDDEVLFSGLEPGLYLVGAGEGRTKPIASARVRVTEGFADALLELDRSLEGQSLMVTCTGPNAEPLFGCKFRYSLSQGQWSNSSGSSDARTAGPGQYRIPFHEIASGEHGIANLPEGWTAMLTVTHPTYGKQQVKLTEGQQEVSVQFQSPASLEVILTGYRKSDGAKNPIYVDVVRSDDPTKNGWNSYGDETTKQPDGDGIVRFAKLAPGLVEVRILSNPNSYPRKTLSTLETELRSGPQSVNLAVPLLHEVVVRAPRNKAEEHLWMTKKRKEGEPYGGQQHAQLDATLRARFAGLTAGEYTLHDNRGGSIDVVVPTGEVLFEPERNNCLKASISDRKGLLFEKGLRGGDVIVAVGSVSLNADNLQEQRQRLYEKGALVTVQRDGKTMQFDLTDAFPQDGNNLGGWIQDGKR